MSDCPAPDHLHVRVVDVTAGDIVVEHIIDQANTEMSGELDGFATQRRLAIGHVIGLEVMDCEGDISPAGEWQRVITDIPEQHL